MMVVLLRNLQNVVRIRRARLRKDVETLKRILGVQRFDVGIVCVDNRRIQHINNIYRKKNMPTDVLSFPFYEDLRPGKLPCALHRDEYNLGDLFLGVEYVMHQCQERSWDFHATLTMFQKENYILREFNRLTGSHLEPLTKRCTGDR
ncbi:endoribonuclease YbeY isoform X3 [Pangasianodon hypophthalmus]|uniref:endoribonuclease YbeY isoform X3 n=1 Tax=Pangasianodon hypophthalmus TaxID=310915 RepID=UPI000F00F7A3|nr:endoribonuclease YbeY isoform X3 [Pangasianodon hypophthalmus]